MKILEGHEDAVKTASFSYEDVWLASASTDGVIRLWTLKKNRKEEVGSVKLLKSHNKSVSTLAFSKEGMLASGSWDSTVKLWNPRNGLLIKTFNGHETWVESISFSLDSFQIVSASKDSIVKVWDIIEDKCTVTLENEGVDIQFCGFTPKNTLIVAGSKQIKPK